MSEVVLFDETKRGLRVIATRTMGGYMIVTSSGFRFTAPVGGSAWNDNTVVGLAKKILQPPARLTPMASPARHGSESGRWYVPCAWPAVWTRNGAAIAG